MQPKLDLLARIPGAIKKQTRRIIATEYYRHYFKYNPKHPALDRERATDALRTADTILFCCWGNICRSPMAAQALRNSVAETTRAEVDIRSAGLGEYCGRSSPPNAITVAAFYGIDLSDHRSVRATPSMIAESDVIFVMDYHTYHLLQTRHSNLGRVYFLSVFADDNIEILDPAGRSRQVFDDVFGTIASATDQIATILNQPGVD